MHQIYEVKCLRQELSDVRKQGQTIALVPTMGNLHAGHLSLVAEAQKHADYVVVSIFVNPTQFNNAHDLANYPRTVHQDLANLKTLNLSSLLVFTPNIDEIYPPQNTKPTTLKASSIAEHLCGATRPGHFDGVVTVVAKLFNVVMPNVAIFGRKDFQQLQVIKALVADLLLPIKIVGMPCVREHSGLALSSRNNLLSTLQKEQAASLYQSLLVCAKQINNKKTSFRELEDKEIKLLQQQGFTVDYFKICNALTLKPARVQDKNLVIAVAAFLGNVRLIDNIEVNL